MYLEEVVETKIHVVHEVGELQGQFARRTLLLPLQTTETAALLDQTPLDLFHLHPGFFKLLLQLHIQIVGNDITTSATLSRRFDIGKLWTGTSTLHASKRLYESTLAHLLEERGVVQIDGGDSGKLAQPAVDFVLFNCHVEQQLFYDGLVPGALVLGSVGKLSVHRRIVELDPVQQ